MCTLVFILMVAFSFHFAWDHPEDKANLNIVNCVDV